MNKKAEKSRESEAIPRYTGTRFFTIYNYVFKKYNLKTH